MLVLWLQTIKSLLKFYKTIKIYAIFNKTAGPYDTVQTDVSLIFTK